MNNAQLLQDSEPIRLLETSRSLSEYILNIYISINNNYYSSKREGLSVSSPLRPKEINNDNY